MQDELSSSLLFLLSKLHPVQLSSPDLSSCIATSTCQTVGHCVAAAVSITNVQVTLEAPGTEVASVTLS